mmetsp:Transcript_109586/g.223965  ORF Transcript_109586/g.223965 Transcript_109586/m.223965 type:complete len:219 (-) Transcript_109586:858-1514(-)
MGNARAPRGETIRRRTRPRNKTNHNGKQSHQDRLSRNDLPANAAPNECSRHSRPTTIPRSPNGRPGGPVREPPKRTHPHGTRKPRNHESGRRRKPTGSHPGNKTSNRCHQNSRRRLLPRTTPLPPASAASEWSRNSGHTTVSRLPGGPRVGEPRATEQRGGRSKPHQRRNDRRPRRKRRKRKRRKPLHRKRKRRKRKHPKRTRKRRSRRRHAGAAACF